MTPVVLLDVRSRQPVQQRGARIQLPHRSASRALLLRQTPNLSGLLGADRPEQSRNHVVRLKWPAAKVLAEHTGLFRSRFRRATTRCLPAYLHNPRDYTGRTLSAPDAIMGFNLFDYHCGACAKLAHATTSPSTADHLRHRTPALRRIFGVPSPCVATDESPVPAAVRAPAARPPCKTRTSQGTKCHSRVCWDKRLAAGVDASTGRLGSQLIMLAASLSRNTAPAARTSTGCAKNAPMVLAASARVALGRVGPGHGRSIASQGSRWG